MTKLKELIDGNSGRLHYNLVIAIPLLVAVLSLFFAFSLVVSGYLVAACPLFIIAGTLVWCAKWCWSSAKQLTDL